MIDEAMTHEGQRAKFLYIPIGRLAILSVASLGLYGGYWIYRNWRYLKERDGLEMTPFWRGIFGVFTIHKLLARIHDDAELNAVRAPGFGDWPLATGWVVLVILSNLLSRGDGLIGLAGVIVGLPAFLFLVPVQRYINSVNEALDPPPPHYGWSAGHTVCLVFGVLFWPLILIGSMG